MTRTEVIEKLQAILEEATEGEDSVSYVTSEDAEALNMAINSLKVDEMYQLEMENAEKFIAKSVIEDIKAEIELQKKGFPPSSNYYKAITRAVNIIDKHISRKEQE